MTERGRGMSPSHGREIFFILFVYQNSISLHLNAIIRGKFCSGIA